MSNGRAEIIVGRGSFTESFPLFGFDLRKYSELFEEKLELLALLIKEKPVTWEGTLRPPHKALVDQIGKERGWPPTTRERFEGEVETGALHVGSPETVAKKIAAMLGIQRLQLKYTSGTIRHDSAQEWPHNPALRVRRQRCPPTRP